MTTKERLLPIKNWFASWLGFSQTQRHYNDNSEGGYLNIPIKTHSSARHFMPVHFSFAPDKTCKLNGTIIQALGGLSNIESYREIPNSQRIRLTLIDPTLVDNALLEELYVRMFIRIGKRIVHIIP